MNKIELTRPWLLVFLMMSSEVQQDSSRTSRDLSRGKAAAKDEVNTTRLTLSAFLHDLRTFRVPWTAVWTIFFYLYMKMKKCTVKIDFIDIEIYIDEITNS